MVDEPFELQGRDHDVACLTRGSSELQDAVEHGTRHGGLSNNYSCLKTRHKGNTGPFIPRQIRQGRLVSCPKITTSFRHRASC